MKFGTKISLFSIIVGLTFVLVIAPSLSSEAHAATKKICSDETISTGTFSSIEVETGKFCIITGDTIVEKNVKAIGSSSITIDGTPLVTIGGNVVIKNSLGLFSINNANVGGNIKLEGNSGDDIIITSSEIGKNLIMKANSASDDLPIMDKIIKIEGNSIEGNVRLVDNFAENDFFIQMNSINGNLVQVGTEVENNDIILEENSIGGNLNFRNNMASGENDFIDNVIAGNVNIIGNTFDDIIYFDNNQVGGKVKAEQNNLQGSNILFSSNNLKNVIIKNNSAGLFSSSNTIDGNLKIKNNDGDLTLIGNSFLSGKLLVSNNQLSFTQIFLNQGASSIIIKNNFDDSSMAIVQNTAIEKIVIKNNDVGGDLICTDNIPVPIGGGNTASGSKTGQCSLL